MSSVSCCGYSWVKISSGSSDDYVGNLRSGNARTHGVGMSLYKRTGGRTLIEHASSGFGFPRLSLLPRPSPARGPDRPAFRGTASPALLAIGIGDAVTRVPLPHHRTCGSATGGSVG